MIPHVELPRHRLSGEERSAFARGSKERKLRIVVDRATVPEQEALELLLGLGHHPLIELLSTRTEGFAHLDIGPIDQHKDKLHEVSWRRPWRTGQLAPVAASLAQLMDAGTAARDALELVALLRNTIHGEALRTVVARHSNRPLQNVLLLPKDQEHQLLAIIDRRGGNDAWGIREHPSLGVSMQLDVFVESSFPMAVNALDSLMGGIEVERLAGVQPAALSAGPPADNPRNQLGDAFDSIGRRQVRLMAGL